MCNLKLRSKPYDRATQFFAGLSVVGQEMCGTKACWGCLGFPGIGWAICFSFKALVQDFWTLSLMDVGLLRLAWGLWDLGPNFFGHGMGDRAQATSSTNTNFETRTKKKKPLDRDDKEFKWPKNGEEREREREVHEQNCTLDNTIGETSSVWTNLM